MKYLGVILLAFLVIALSGCEKQDTTSSELLIGTWTSKGDALVTYNPDGTSGTVADVPGLFSNTRFVANTTWYVKDGYLYNTVTSSTDPEKVPVRFKAADKIVKLNATSFTYISGVSGQTQTDTRVSSK